MLGHCGGCGVSCAYCCHWQCEAAGWLCYQPVTEGPVNGPSSKIKTASHAFRQLMQWSATALLMGDSNADALWACICSSPSPCFSPQCTAAAAKQRHLNNIVDDARCECRVAAYYLFEPSSSIARDLKALRLAPGSQSNCHQQHMHLEVLLMVSKSYRSVLS